MEKTYVAIDLKSFYASAECVQRGLDPLNTNLVVADLSRTEKTICLAVSPSLKSYGISGRARLFEVVQRVREVNTERLAKAPGRTFSGKSYIFSELNEDPSLELDYIVAPPQMHKYMEISTKIYQMYLKFVAPEDIHVYSIDEVFIDATKYLDFYHVNAHEFTMMLVRAVLNETGITATAGIGTNLYLCKIAMDIVAKHIPADKDGVRIAQLDEMSYRKQLWDHRPLTDFWRVGRGYQRRLESHGLYTMGDIARCSLGRPSDFHNEELLYKLFGINAELLIDHAWGWEPCTIADIKSYRSENNSISSGQVLSYPYTFEEARIVVQEMADLLVLDLVRKDLVTNQMVLTVGYDASNLTDPEIRAKYHGPVKTAHYGKPLPDNSHGSINLSGYTSSTKEICEAVMELYDRIVNRDLLVRRMYVVANRVISPLEARSEQVCEQLDMFTDYEAKEKEKREKEEELALEKKEQETILEIKKKFGKNAILKGTNLQEAATARDRNNQIGGHRA
ncbi:MAG: DNA methylase [Firmicutes bacterium]|nr:DNA methylase [Bacillota bacterium]